MNKFLTCCLALASLAFVTSCSEHNHADHDHPDDAATTEATMSADTATAPAGTATTYTCPMHPEVVTSQPGQCPKCGMDLVVKK